MSNVLKSNSAKLLPSPVAPENIARSLFIEINSIDDEIKQSQKRIQELSARPFYRGLFSGRKDRLAASEQQNSINIKMMTLIERHIQMNVLSVAALTAVLEDFKDHVDSGFKDSHGNTVRLSDNGKKLADSMSTMILGVIQSAERTRDSIDSFEGHVAASNARFDHIELTLSLHGSHLDRLSTGQEDIRQIGQRSLEELSNISRHVDEHSTSLLAVRDEIAATSVETNAHRRSLEDLALEVASLRSAAVRHKLAIAILFLTSWGAISYLALR